MSARGSRPPAGRPAVLLAALLVGVVVLWIGFSRLREGRRTRAAWPTIQGALVVQGLVAPVEVVRDRRGIPHIEARSEAEALFALGFVHAQDRLAQMVWLSRVAHGRASELGGKAFVDADRRARILGLGRLASDQAEALDGGTRALLDAYVAGVNARIARIRARRIGLPKALAALGATLEPWSAADTLAVAKLHAWSLSDSLETSAVLLEIIQQVGGLAARPFFPEGVGIGAVPVGTEARLDPSRPLGDPLRRAAGLAGPALGSSAWVVSGARSVSGRPLLAGDLHLDPVLPARVYEAHLRGGGLDVAGATLPGVPVFWMGRNAHVAWAAVHARAVVADLYSETLDPDQPSHYHDGRRRRELVTREETIVVRGGEPVQVIVRATHHGPLVDDLVAPGGQSLALSWAGARTDPGLGGLLGVARARNAAALRSSLADHREPVVAVAYATDEGEAGVQLAGWVPRRRYPAGLVPVPGRSAIYEWSGPVPFRELPHARVGGVDRGRGWLVAADNVLPGAAEAGIEWLWRPGARAERIEALLRSAASAGPLDARTLAAIQGDLRSARAAGLVEDAFALAGGKLDNQAAEVVDALRHWNGESATDSRGAALYHVFVHELTERLLAERLGAALLKRWLGLAHADPVELAGRLLAGARAGGRDPGGWDDPATVRRAVREALRHTWIFFSVEVGPNRDKWTWGRLHRLRFAPLLPVGRGVEPGLGPFEGAGDGQSVAAAAFDPAEPFATRSASLYRLVVDLGEQGHALSALAPGQSEHPGQAWRESGLARWRARRPSLLVSGSLLVEEGAVARLELVPPPRETRR